MEYRNRFWFMIGMPRVEASLMRSWKSVDSCAVFFFFQAEDGIRDLTVTGVQTCALPICSITALDFQSFLDGGAYGSYGVASTFYTGALQTVTYEVPRYRFRGLRAFTNKQIGRASCRERV